MIGGQRAQAGLPHAGKMAEVIIEAATCQITVEGGIAVTAPRTTSPGHQTAPACPVRPASEDHPCR